MTLTYVESLKPRRQKAGFGPSAHSWIVKKGSASPGASRLQVAHVHDELSEYATRRLRALVESGQITPGTARRARGVLAAISSPGSVFPHISADDNELTMLWLAGPSSIEIVLSDRGPIYVRCTNSSGRESVMGFFQAPPLSRLRGLLARLSIAVASVNPRWRSSFAS